MSEKVENRNRSVLEAAVELAGSHGYAKITRQQIAERAGVAVGSVNNAFGTMEALRDAVMATAVARGIARIVGQGLADQHPAAVAAPPELKQSALAALAA